MRKAVVTLEPAAEGGVVATKYEPISECAHGVTLSAEVIEVPADKKIEFYAGLALAELMGALTVMDGEQARAFKRRIEEIGERVEVSLTDEDREEAIAHLKRSLAKPAPERPGEN